MVSSSSKSANRPFLFASSVSVAASPLGPLGKSLGRSESQGGMGKGRGIRSGVGDGLARGRPVIDCGLRAQEGGSLGYPRVCWAAAPGWSRMVPHARWLGLQWGAPKPGHKEGSAKELLGKLSLMFGEGCWSVFMAWPFLNYKCVCGVGEGRGGSPFPSSSSSIFLFCFLLSLFYRPPPPHNVPYFKQNPKPL